MDDREDEERAAEILALRRIEARSERLSVGDYAFGDVGVEFKTITDLFGSIRKDYFWRQLEELETNCKKPILVVMGDIEDYLKDMRKSIPKYRYMKWFMWEGVAGRTREQYWSILDSILKSRRVGLHECHDMKAFKNWLVRSAQREENPTKSHQGRQLVTSKPRDRSNLEEQVDTIRAIGGVGETTAKALLDKFGTPRNTFSASVTELMQVKGVGQKTAEHIHKVAQGKPEDS